MNYVDNFVFTQFGFNLMAKWGMGAERIIGDIWAGSGTLGGQNPLDLTDLINPVALATHNVPTRDDSTINFDIEFRNFMRDDLGGDILEAFALTEIGVFAIDPDLGRGLIARLDRDNFPIPIPSTDTQPIIEHFPISIPINGDGEIRFIYPSFALMTENEVMQMIHRNAQLLDLTNIDRELPNLIDTNNLSAGSWKASQGQFILNAPSEYHPGSSVMTIHHTDIDGDNAHQEVRIQHEVYGIASRQVFNISAGGIMALSSDSQTLRDLPIGSVVMLPEDGILVPWLVAEYGDELGNDYYGASGSVALVRENFHNEQRAMGSNTSDYENSDLHIFLNSDFINSIDLGIREKITEVRIPFHQVSDTLLEINNGADGLKTKIFLLSAAEVGCPRGTLNNMPLNEEGVRFSLFEAGNEVGGPGRQSRLAFSTAQPSTPAVWRLRTPRVPVVGATNISFIVNNSGALGIIESHITASWRPALFLPGDLTVIPSGEITPPQPDPQELPQPSTPTISNNTLNWNAVQNTIGYQVYIDGNPASGTITTTTFDLSGLGLLEGSHSVQVRAIGDGVAWLNSALSNSVTFTVEPLPAIQLSPPTSLTITGDTLTFYPATGVVGYRVYADSLAVSNIFNATTFDLSALILEYGTHQVQVRSIGDYVSYNHSELSEPVEWVGGVKPQPPRPPAPATQNLYILFRAKIDGVWHDWERVGGGAPRAYVVGRTLFL